MDRWHKKFKLSVVNAKSCLLQIIAFLKICQTYFCHLYENCEKINDSKQVILLGLFFVRLQKYHSGNER